VKLAWILNEDLSIYKFKKKINPTTFFSST